MTVSSVTDIARGILGLLGPLMGTRAMGRAFFLPKEGAAGMTRLECNTWMHACIDGSIRPRHVVRVLPNADEDDGHWDVPPAGRLVRIETIQCGASQNLHENTELRFVMIPTGFYLRSAAVADGGLVGGSDVTDFDLPRVAWMGVAESFQVSQQGLDLFRTGVDATPAILITWAGAEPADGITSSTIDRGRNRKGVGKLLEKEQYRILIVVDRMDGDIARREQGLLLFDEVRALLVDQQHYGEGRNHVAISIDDPIQFRRGYRVNSNTDKFFQQNYVYGIDLAVTRLWTKRVHRVAHPWRYSDIKSTGVEPNLAAGGSVNRLTSSDVKVKMPQDGDG